jgi:hypothetical protein
MPWLVMHSIVRPAGTSPAAITQPLGKSAPPLPADGRFALPPWPPAIEGSPEPDRNAPGAPTLDMRQGPAM